MKKREKEIVEEKKAINHSKMKNGELKCLMRKMSRKMENTSSVMQWMM